MTAAVDVSLLVCTRNRAGSLAATLESVERAATYARNTTVEVVVVDNGSVDNTPQRLAQWQAGQTYRSTSSTNRIPGSPAHATPGLRAAPGASSR